MKTANEIIEIFLSAGKRLNEILKSNELTTDDIEVLLYDETKQVYHFALGSAKEQPISLIYSITQNKPYGIIEKFTNSKSRNKEKD